MMKSCHSLQVGLLVGSSLVVRICSVTAQSSGSEPERVVAISSGIQVLMKLLRSTPRAWMSAVTRDVYTASRSMTPDAGSTSKLAEAEALLFVQLALSSSSLRTTRLGATVEPTVLT